MLPALTPGETANTLIPKKKKKKKKKNKHRTVALKDKASVILVPVLFFLLSTSLIKIQMLTTEKDK